MEELITEALEKAYKSGESSCTPRDGLTLQFDWDSTGIAMAIKTSAESTEQPTQVDHSVVNKAVAAWKKQFEKDNNPPTVHWK